MDIALTYNLKPANLPTDQVLAERYAEFDTQDTINGIIDAIRSNGHYALPIEANEYAYEKLRDKKIDFVFNFAEGINGEDREAHIPAMCEMLGLPYLGQTPLVSAILLDKVKTKELLDYYDINTPKFQVFKNADKNIASEIGYPAIVKPSKEGSSKGIWNDSVVDNDAALERKVKEIIAKYKQPALVEPFLTGREFTVAIIGNADSIEAFPIVEINHGQLPDSLRIDSYEAKWVAEEHFEDSAACPANLPKTLELEIVSLCKKAYNYLGCRDWARVDVRLDGKEIPYILELNSPCGLLPNPKDCSRFPLAAKAAGYDFNQLIGKLINTAAKRYEILQLLIQK